MSASQPPSGDAPDLRAALLAFGERLAAEGYGWEAIITRETPSGEETVAHLTTANPDPAALATPAPLDVDVHTLAEAIRLWYVEVSFNDRPVAHWVAHRYAALRARAYAEQEGGE